jgi:hypothetical protein
MNYRGVIAAAALAAVAGVAWGQVCEFEDLGRLRLGEFPGDGRGADRVGDLLYITITSELRIYDAGEPEALRLLSQSSFAPSRGVAVRESLAVLSGRQSVATIDAADPAAPRLLDTIATPGDGFGIVIDGSVAFIADGYEGVAAVDVSDPEEMRLLHVLDTPGRAYQIVVQDGVAYVADSAGGLRILDVRDPERMVEIASLTEWTVYGVAVEDALLGLATSRDGVVFVDVSDPAAPLVVGRMETRGSPTAVKLIDSTAWVSTGGLWGPAEFIGVDARGPSSPVEFGSAEFPLLVRGAYCVDFTVSDGHAHILLNQFDASYAPVKVDLHTVDVRPCPVCAADCDGSGGLDFFDFLCFQNLFAAGDPAADCDGSGELDLFDFLCFQNEFAAGCP